MIILDIQKIAATTDNAPWSRKKPTEASLQVTLGMPRDRVDLSSGNKAVIQIGAPIISDTEMKMGLTKILMKELFGERDSGSMKSDLSLSAHTEKAASTENTTEVAGTQTWVA
ncbi:MAG: hypothetical protein H7832_07720 [Magnetococcus sp. DMHC-6]